MYQYRTGDDEITRNTFYTFIFEAYEYLCMYIDLQNFVNDNNILCLIYICAFDLIVTFKTSLLLKTQSF